MITVFLLPEIEACDFNDFSFQQDGATYHTSRETKALFREQFNKQLILRCGPVNYGRLDQVISHLQTFRLGQRKVRLRLRNWKPLTE